LENIRELYILGRPIETELGIIHFVKVKDYTSIIKYIPYLQLQKFEILDAIAKMNKDIAEDLKDVPFIDMIRELKDVFEVYNMFEELFLFLFKDNVFDYIETDEQFEYYKKLIHEMNCIPIEEKNPNPEIQYFINLKKQLERQRSKGGITFESIYTSVWATTGKEPLDMTIYSMYALFGRIGQFKNFDTTTLYNSVSGEVPIEPWFKHIDLMNSDEAKTTLDEFGRDAQQYTN
jgi:hypothetical protein